MSVNLWVNAEHALAYLRERDTLPHRVEALEMLCELLPARVERVLRSGTPYEVYDAWRVLQVDRWLEREAMRRA